MHHCLVCQHPQSQDISADLLKRIPYRTIASRYSVSRSALSRHVTEHIPKALRLQAARERVQMDPEPVLVQMRKLNLRALAVLQQAEDAKDRPGVLLAVRECRRNLELIAKLTGELDPRSPVEGLGGPITVTVTYVDKAIIATPATPPLLTDGD
jgi:hypothetical protein